MSKKDINFEYKVVNWDTNGNNIEYYNIFNNIRVYESTLKLCEKFKKDNLTFEQFTEEIRKIIAWQERGRCEYECLVTSWPYHENRDEMIKIDCYEQAVQNIKIIAKYVLETYYPRLKVDLNNDKVYNIINQEVRK